MEKKIVVAIDGPAGSGKSTSAKLVAGKLGYIYIDTGAMYRTVTYEALRRQIADDEQAVSTMVKEFDISLRFENGSTRVFLGDEEVTDFIRTKEVNAKVSDISTMKDVRIAMVEKQRELGCCGGVVMEGRDIGSAVFPGAEVKIFLVASLEQRAERRYREFTEQGKNIDLEEVRANLQKRDSIDSSRAMNPLMKTDDAVEIDTSNITIDEQVNLIMEQVKKALSEQ